MLPNAWAFRNFEGWNHMHPHRSGPMSVPPHRNSTKSYVHCVWFDYRLCLNQHCPGGKHHLILNSVAPTDVAPFFLSFWDTVCFNRPCLSKSNYLRFTFFNIGYQFPPFIPDATCCYYTSPLYFASCRGYFCASICFASRAQERKSCPYSGNASSSKASDKLRWTTWSGNHSCGYANTPGCGSFSNRRKICCPSFSGISLER